MGLLPTGTGDWLAFETRGLVRACPFLPLQDNTDVFLGTRGLTILNRQLPTTHML